MRHSLLIITFLAVVSIAASACGGGSGDETTTDGDGTTAPQETEEMGVVPIPVNSEVVVGPNRFGLALIGEDNTPILESPDTSVRLTFSYEGVVVKDELDTSFTWAIPDVNGFWNANVEFDDAGEWEGEAVITRSGEDTTVSFTFVVLPESVVPNVGAAAVPTENLTLATESNLLRITTDLEPEESFYEMTVTDAIEADRPFVLVFATPAFCQTRFCGPVVDNIKVVWQDFGDQANFIHIEPFELDAEGQLVTGTEGPITAQSTLDWILPTEPWIFVVDADGIIAARFEGAAGASEITEALEATLG